MERDRLTRFRYGVHEFFYTLLTFPRAWRFMLNHRLWTGLRQYGWVARGLVIFGIIVALVMVGEVVEWWTEHNDEPLYVMAIGRESILLQWFWEAYESLSDGALNWVILILLEVIIYHFMRRTLQIVVQRDVEHANRMRPFLQAQWRMIQVSVMSLVIQETVISVGGAFIPDGLEWIFETAVQAIILGYAIADNYNEQFGLSIEQSLKHLYRNYIGVCAGLGLPLLLMLKVPVVGTVLGPLVTSVTAAIVLREKSDLHLVGYQMSEKEERKAAEKAARKAAKASRKAAKAGAPLS